MLAAGGLVAGGPLRAAARSALTGPAAAGRGPALAGVTVGSESDFALLQAFDLTECRHGNEVQVVLWPGDAERLSRLGFNPRILEPDLAELDRRIALADQAQQSSSVRVTYRRLADYENELRALAATYPGFVRLVEGPELTAEGRKTLGVEIATDVNGDDGRPTCFIMGLHHAREWPSAELTMNFANELAQGVAGGHKAITAALTNARVLLVPVVNVDGFVYSREFPVSVYEYPEQAVGAGSFWRKNRRGAAAAAGQSLGAYGVDPNRNYGYQWGGAGWTSTSTSPNPLWLTYQGDAPFSEPEPRNVRSFVLTRQVTTLITNHTYSDLVLWPWGNTYRDAPDADILAALGRDMAASNGYRPMQSIYLYPTYGSTEDWAYAATGTMGYTFEHGHSFHPEYGAIAPMYAKNRAAFMKAVRAAADSKLHGVITGRVRTPVGAGISDLELRRLGRTPDYDGNELDDAFVTRMRTDSSGSFSWHVNPSTRPIASGPEAYELRVTGPFPSDPITVTIARGQRVDLGVIVV